MKSRIFFVILFLQLIRKSEQLNCEFSGNCNVEPNIAEIKCTKTAEPQCECIDGSGGNDDKCTALEAGKFTYDTLDVDTCKEEKCTAATCSFWKYLKNKESLIYTKHCYLMKDDQCSSEDDAVTCPEDDQHDSKPKCRSGVSPTTTDEDCDGGEIPPTKIPGPPTPAPDLKPCKGPILQGGDTTMHYQKWNCFALVNDHFQLWNMYEKDSMPADGYCLLDESNGSCRPEQSFKYECKEDSNSLGESKWQGSADQELVDNTGKLKEVGCKAVDLVMADALVHQDGRIISCVNEYVESEGTIKAENNCIMLCDSLPAFAFYTDFKSGEEGRDWFYEQFDTPGSKGTLVAGMLDCWGKR